AIAGLLVSSSLRLVLEELVSRSQTLLAGHSGIWSHLLSSVTRPSSLAALMLVLSPVSSSQPSPPSRLQAITAWSPPLRPSTSGKPVALPFAVQLMSLVPISTASSTRMSPPTSVAASSVAKSNFSPRSAQASRSSTSRLAGPRRVAPTTSLSPVFRSRSKPLNPLSRKSGLSLSSSPSSMIPGRTLANTESSSTGDVSMSSSQC
ncbi:cell wall glucanase, partial [Trichophyton equinum CBS 127.97]